MIMFSNCILREEDGYQCPGKNDENCDGCAYNYNDEHWIYGAIGAGIWALICICILIAVILTSPIWLLAILFERINRNG
mgnify:CR=1 FL=1